MEFAWDTEESLTEGSDSIGFSFMGYLRGRIIGNSRARVG